MEKVGRSTTAIRITNLEELKSYVLLHGGDRVQIDVPIDVKISEYKAIAEFADARGFAIEGEKEKLEVMMQRREREIKEIDRTIGEIRRTVDELDRKLRSSSK